MLTALAFFFAPLVFLAVAGVVSAARAGRHVWPSVLAIALVSTLTWLVYVGLYQHETPCGFGLSRCDTVYGYAAPLPDEHIAGTALLLVGFLVPAAWFGWRGRVPPFTVGAALAIGPTVLAWWTAPRGDNDGLWALIFWMLPVLGAIAAGVAAMTASVRDGRERAAQPGPVVAVAASTGDRVAALAIDVALAAIVLLAPLTALSDAHCEVLAAALGIVLPSGYMGLAIAWKGRTLGQSLIGLTVVEEHRGGRVGIVRSLLRSLVVVLEVAGAPTLFLALPAAAEVMALSASGRTITDRVLGTAVVSYRSAAVSEDSAAADIDAPV